MDTEQYPYMVSLYVRAQIQNHPVLASILGDAYWVDYARCRTEMRAKEVALCLAIRHRLVRVSQLQGDRFVPVMWYPDEATVKRETTI